jgi:hypothetical protein
MLLCVRRYKTIKPYNHYEPQQDTNNPIPIIIILSPSTFNEGSVQVYT